MCPPREEVLIGRVLIVHPHGDTVPCHSIRVWLNLCTITQYPKLHADAQQIRGRKRNNSSASGRFREELTVLCLKCSLKHAPRTHWHWHAPRICWSIRRRRGDTVGSNRRDCDDSERHYYDEEEFGIRSTHI